MSKKPPLTLVEPDGTTVPPPPRDLGKPGRALWDAVQREFDVSDVCGVELLAQACSALTKAEALHAEIERDGPVLRDRRGIKDHGAEARISQQGFRGADVDAARVEFRAAAQRGRQARGATWMTSKRTTRTRHPHKPITPEILKLFDRALAGDKAENCRYTPREYSDLVGALVARRRPISVSTGRPSSTAPQIGCIRTGRCCRRIAANSSPRTPPGKRQPHELRHRVE